MKEYYTALDGLRAVAVGIVLLAHAGSPYPRSGGVGVDIFFVLSGFLITSILRNEFQSCGRISRKNFYVRRFLRLSPCLIVTTALFSFLFLIKNGDFPTDIVLISLTYTANWARALFNYDLHSMAHCWSLAIEEQYYLIWPFIVIFLEKASKNNLIKFISLAILALCLALYRAAFVGIFDAARIYFGLDTHMDGLVIGSSLSYLVASVKNSDHSYVNTYKFLSWLLVPVAIIGLMVLMYLITWGDPWMGKLGFVMVAGATWLIILDLVLSPFSLIKDIVAFPILVYIGKISYGLYLFHFPIYHFINYVYPDLSGLFRVPMKFFVSFFVAAISYHCIEVKFLRLKRYFTNTADTGNESNRAGQTSATSAMA